MLTIHDAQMKAFERELEEDFKDRALAHLLSLHGPGAAWVERAAQPLFAARTRVFQEAELREVVERGLVAARAHGLGTEAQAVAFMELCVLHGLDFHTRGAAAEILSSAGTPASRLRALQALGPSAEHDGPRPHPRS